MSDLRFFETKDNKLTGVAVKYGQSDVKRIAVSNNVQRLNMVSTLTLQELNPARLAKAKVGTNVKALDTNCFRGCSNLAEVQGGQSLTEIGHYAFTECSKLSSVSFMTHDSGIQLDSIGVSAFTGTAIQDAYVNLRGTATETEIFSYAFAGCQSLSRVVFVNRDYLADYMFAGDSTLTSVQFCDGHSFLGEHVFENCTGLTNVTLPKSMLGINSYTFNGCTNLTSLVIAEPSSMKYASSIKDHIMSGTAVRSFTFPTSITSFSQIDDFALVGATQLKEIKFAGMAAEQLWKTTETKTVSTSEFPTNIWLYDSDCGYQNAQQCGNFSYLIEYAKAAGIPLVLNWTRKSGCSYCTNLKNDVINTSEFVNWMKSLPKQYLFGVIELDQSSLSKSFRTFFKSISGNGASQYPSYLMYWKKPDGSEVSHAYPLRSPHTKQTYFDEIRNFIESECASYQGVTQQSSTATLIAAGITGTHCFGLNHSATIYSSDGKSITYEDDGTGSSGQIMYESETRVDAVTIDDFRYGQWYKNAKELREYADANHIPVFVEYGSKNCIPCHDFHQLIFNDPGFQSYVSGKKMLFCTVQSQESFRYNAENYISQKWIHVDKKDMGKLPIWALYQNAQVVDTYVTEIGEYVTTTVNQPMVQYYPYDVDAHTAETLTAAMEQWTVEYQPEAKFERPPIYDYTSNSTNKYKVYQNQVDDWYGRYFPVASHVPTNSGFSYTVQLLNAQGAVFNYAITPGGLDCPFRIDPEPPAGTYQYYTTQQTGNDYELTCDMYGILFKVGETYGDFVVLSAEYPYGNKQAPQYMLDNGLTGDNIYDGKYSFFQYVYKSDGSGYVSPPTVDQDACFRTQTQQYNACSSFQTQQYNACSSFSVRNVQVTGQDGNVYDVSKVMIRLSSAVSLADGNTTVVPTGTPCVIEARYYAYRSDGKSGLQWLSSFSNYEGE